MHQALLIELGLQEQPDALANPWHLTIQEMNQIVLPLPEGTHITQVYDDADGELLILGEPGGGKTTLLLALARDLLKRAEEEQDHPVPVVFNLSSWATKRQPLATWLIEELHTKYRFSRNVATSWINRDQVIVLLDGLDEVAPETRSACVKAINAYQRARDLVSVVVCSRSGEYFAQAQRLLLQQAVMIRPLTAEQIETYLSQLGERVAGVHRLLQDDLWLRELTTTQEAHQALIAVRSASERVLLVGRFAARRRHLFTTYTERMLHRRGPSTYAPQPTIQWLSWLAKTMLLNDQMIFSVEKPLKKLPNPPPLPRIYGFLGFFVASLLLGLVAMPVGLFATGLIDWLVVLLSGGLVVLLSVLLSGGLVVLLSVLLFNKQRGILVQAR